MFSISTKVPGRSNFKRSEILQAIIEDICSHRCSPIESIRSYMGLDDDSANPSQPFQLNRDDVGSPENIVNVGSTLTDEQKASPDWEKLLKQVLDVQEEMSLFMSDIHGIEKLFVKINILDKETKEPKEINTLKELNDWVTRFNVWLNSDAYKAYAGKDEAWRKYKLGLSRLKAKAAAEKDRLSRFWKAWKNKQAECTRLIGANTWIWKWFFDLVEQPIEGRFLSSDPVDIDEQVVLFQDSYELMEELEKSHCADISYRVLFEDLYPADTNKEKEEDSSLQNPYQNLRGFYNHHTEEHYETHEAVELPLHLMVPLYPAAIYAPVPRKV